MDCKELLIFLCDVTQCNVLNNVLTMTNEDHTDHKVYEDYCSVSTKDAFLYFALTKVYV